MVQLVIAFLLAEMLCKIGTDLISGRTTPSIQEVCFILALYAGIGIAAGAITGLAVHFCAKSSRVLFLGVSASRFLNRGRTKH